MRDVAELGFRARTELAATIPIELDSSTLRP